MSIEKCSICMNNMIGQIHELICKHQFHHSCIKDLFCVYMNDKCPLCRANYTYQPSKKQKPKKNMRNKMLKHNTNRYGIMTREKCADMHFFFKSRKIDISFLKRMIFVLSTRGDYNFIRYTKDIIILSKTDTLATGARLLYQNRDLTFADFAEQEQFRQELHPIEYPIENNESDESDEDTESESDEEKSDNDTEFIEQHNIVSWANTFNLNVFHMTQLFRRFHHFIGVIHGLQNMYGDDANILMHQTLLHVHSLSPYHDGEELDYCDDERVCNMYNIEQSLLNHLYNIHPGFNIYDIERQALSGNHMDEYVIWVRNQIFEVAIDQEILVLENIQDINELNELAPHDIEYGNLIDELLLQYEEDNEDGLFLEQVRDNQSNIFQTIMDYFSRNMHGPRGPVPLYYIRDV